MPYKRKADYNAFMRDYMKEYRENMKQLLNKLRSQGLVDTRIRHKHRKRKK